LGLGKKLRRFKNKPWQDIEGETDESWYIVSLSTSGVGVGTLISRQDLAI
jgi:hypothetical protein